MRWSIGASLSHVGRANEAIAPLQGLLEDKLVLGVDHQPNTLRSEATFGLLIGHAGRIDDVDVKEGTVTVLHGKGDRQRTTGFARVPWLCVEEWLKARDRLDIPRRGRIL